MKTDFVPGYQVQLHNDDDTPMEFIIELLERFFAMDKRCATTKMLEAHQEGQAVCGVYTKDIAASKIAQVECFASHHCYPVIFSMEVAR